MTGSRGPHARAGRTKQRARLRARAPQTRDRGEDVEARPPHEVQAQPGVVLLEHPLVVVAALESHRITKRIRKQAEKS